MNKSLVDQWVIKLSTDQVKGPYSTEAVQKMIAAGAFSGSEHISKYPDGEWQVLTKQAEFYESLLESLENPVDVDNKKAQKMEAETVIRVMTPEKPAPEETPEEKEDAPETMQDEFKKLLQGQAKTPVVKQPPSPQALKAIADAQKEKETKALLQQRDNNLTIQMADIEKMKNRELRKFFPFFIILILVTVAAYFFYFQSGESSTKGWTLLAPQKATAEALTEPQVKDIKKKAVRAFQQGHAEAILRAHKDLVNAVEGSPRDLEAMGMLCMAYEHLWPYTKQTSQDLKSILIVSQMARVINPISNYSDACQVVYLITKGQMREARSLLEKTLDQQVDERFSLGPFLYLIKAEMLEYDQNFVNATAYYDQASQLWPQWITSKFGLAKMYYKQGKFNEALSEYKAIQGLDKESKAALYGLALVELKGFKSADKAYNFFSTGYKLKQTLPKDFHIEALYNYAQLLVERSENKKALEVARSGYLINPSHRALKELVLSLGGDDRVENAMAEIVLLGDQFVRTGDHLAAQAQYKAAFDLDPKNASAALKAAKSLWALNQSKEAINWLDKALKADPTFVQAAILKADYESQRYNFAEASTTLINISRKAPQNHEVLKGQALLEFRKNNIVGAIQYGERAVKIYDADVELLTLLAQAHTLYYLYGPGTKKEDQDKKSNSRDAASRYAGKAIDLEPSWPESQITYAKFLSAKDGPLREELYLKDLVKSFPYTTEYRIALAEYYKTNEKYTEAAEIYQQVVELEPKNKKANFGLGEAYRVLNKPELAQRYYNATSVLDPSDVEPLFSNAKLLLESATDRDAKGKITQALAKLKVVKEINPNFPRVSFYLAKCFMELGDFQQAIDLIREEKTKNPNLADPFLLAAEIFIRKEQYADCASEYAFAIKLRPTADLYVKASICYRKSDSIDIAQDMIDSAKQKEDGLPEIYREQGYIFEKKGFNQQAKESFQKYLELSPNAPDRGVVESRINGG